MRTSFSLVLALAACNGGPIDVIDEQPVACPHVGALVEELAFGTVAIGGINVLALEIPNDCEGQIALGIAATVEGDDAFTLVEDRVGIAAGAAGILEIRFSPLDYDVHEAVLALQTTDPTHPEAIVRLSGQAGPDQDGDGYEAVETGGRDCDDSDPDAFPGNEEIRDLADNDCDGSVDEGFVLAGDLFVTEMMVRPSAVADAAGEWIELYNASGDVIELRGWHVGPSPTLGFTIEESFVLLPGAFAVIGADADPALNGGIAVDLEWPGAYSLPDDSSTIALTLDGAALFTVDYTTGWPHEEGASLALDSTSFSAAEAALARFWCASSTELASGDRATPGAANDWCESVDHDGDGVTEGGGDCDDADPDVGPSATELWNGRDDDCDGQIDDLSTARAQASLVGTAGDYLGYSAVTAGDLDGDGADELAIGSVYGASSRGKVYVLEASDWADWAGDKAADHDEASFSSTTGRYLGDLPGRFADHTDDGQVDLLVGGTDYGGGSAWALLEGPITGTLDLTDATVTGAGYTSYGTGAVAAPDMDGDGVAEVAYGNYYSGAIYTGTVTVHDVGGASGAVDAADADLYLTGGAASAYAGSALIAGDLDDDGYEDLVVGAYGSGTGVVGGGAVYVVSGGKSYATTGTLDAVASLWIEGTTRNQYLGYDGSLAIADVDGDGGLDLVASAPYGRTVYVVLNAGSISGTVDDSDADLTLEDGSSTGAGYFGWSVTTGDLDTDGASEILVSNYGGASAVQTYVFGGLSSGAYSPDDAIAILSTGGFSESIGATLVTDLDADGTPEVVFSTPSTAGAAGAVWFFDL